MHFWIIYALGGLLLLSAMILLWLTSLALHNSSIVDIFWGVGFVMTYWLYFLLIAEGHAGRNLLLGLLVTAWGLRLSLYILGRNWKKPEDFRYRAWREEAGARWWWFGFFKVFLLQGVLLWLISMPLLAAQGHSLAGGWHWLDYVGVAVWGIGFYFEAVGDWQLTRFKADPTNRGKLLRTGVWRYTRHPNYFGDAAQWWGYYFFALASGAWWTIYSPLMMTYLLRNVSGVTMLEKNLSQTKPGYQEYVASTNAFFPWIPKRQK